MNNFDTTLNNCPLSKMSDTYLFSNEQLEALFRRARKEGPVTYMPDVGYWAVTKYADTKEILSNKEYFSAEITQQPLIPYGPEVLELFKRRKFGPRPTLSNNERDDHARLRLNTLVGFSPSRNKKLEPYIRKLVNDAIDAFATDKQADLLKQMLYELPALVLFKLLGIPESDVQDIKMWSDSRLVLSFGKPDMQQQLHAANHICDYWDYCRALVEQRIDNPQDDLPSDLIKTRNGDDSVLEIEDIVNIVYGLLFAGHETTTNMSSNAVLTLLQHQESWQAIVKDPKLIPNAVEECMRFRSSVVAWRRLVRKDVEICGVKVAAGERVMLFLPSANRDEARFDDSEVFDIHRKDARRHVAFGFGRHVCLGASLARLELKIILEELNLRLPGLRLVKEQSLMPVEAVQFRGPEELWVEWG